MVGYRAGKKTKKRQKALERAKQTLEKEQKKSGKKKVNPRAAAMNSVAIINSLYDPYDFAEKLFHQLEKSTDRFEVWDVQVIICEK